MTAEATLIGHQAQKRMLFMSWLGRPSSYPSANESGFNTRFLILSSILFWAVLCALGLIFLVDFSLTPTLHISVFSSWQNVQSFLYSLIVFAVLCGVLGGIAALPSAIVNRLFSPQIESLYRRSWSLPRTRIVFFKYSSLGLLLISNFLLLSLSLGAAPQYSRGRATQPGIVATWSQFVYDLLYAPGLKERGQGVVAKLNAQTSAKTYVVFAPSSILSQPDVFVRLRKEIGEPVPFFADAPDLPTQIIQMLNGSIDFYQTYNAPVLTRRMLESATLTDTTLSTLIGLGESQLNIRLSSELSELERAFSNELTTQAKQQLLQNENSDTHSQTTIKKRMVMSQPHLFLPFRMGLGKLFDKSWEWTNLVADDGIEIIDTLQKQLEAKKTPGLTVIQLDELEQIPNSLFHPFSSLRWPVISGLLEKQKIVSRSDELLAQLAATVKKIGNVSLMLLPYPDLKTNKQLAWAFIYLPDSHPLKARYIQNQNTNGWVTSFAASDYLRASLPNELAIEEDSFNNDHLCQPILYTFGKNDATQTLLNAWNFVELTKSQNFDAASDLRFLFKTRSSYAVFCKNVFTDSTPKRTNGYIFQFLVDENLNLRDKPLLASLFQQAAKFELPIDKRSALKDTSVKKPEKDAQPYLKLLSKLKIHRVIEQDFRQFDISPLSESQQEPVMKTFYDEFIRVSDDISHGQLFWD